MATFADQLKADRDAILNQEFGVAATYTPSGGTAKEIRVLLDRSGEQAEGEVFVVQGAVVDLYVDRDDAPDLGPGDTFAIDGTTYEVNGEPPPPDDGGLIAVRVQEQ
ncbi:MAG: head-tail joining protein [Thiohalospira sp.]